MNRISSYLTLEPTNSHPGLKAERRLQKDAEAMLRDLAFVLKMTQRVKAQILEENATSDSVAV